MSISFFPSHFFFNFHFSLFIFFFPLSFVPGNCLSIFFSSISFIPFFHLMPGRAIYKIFLFFFTFFLAFLLFLFIFVPSNNDKKTHMKKALFTLDCSENVYQGFTDGQRWNGWFMPWLPLSEVERFLSSESFNPECGPRFVWEGGNLFEIDSDGERDLTPVKVIDGLLCYQLGNGWVWDIVK